MKITHRIIACILILVSLLTCCVACADDGEPILTFRDAELPNYMYQYWTAIYKAQFLAYQPTGIDAPGFWDSIYYDDVTYGAHCKAAIDGAMKRLVIGLSLFEIYDLSLAKELVYAIEEDIAEKEKFRGEEFERDLANIGITKKQLREIYIAQEKLTAVKDYLLNSSNSELGATEDDINAYYNANYMRVKCLILYTNKHIVKNADGKYVPDRTLTDAEIAEKKELLSTLCTRANNGEDFDALIAKYGEYNMESFSNGMLFDKTAISTYDDLVPDENMLLSVEKLSQSSEKAVFAETGDIGYVIYRYDTLADRNLLSGAEKNFITTLESRTNDKLFLDLINTYLDEVETTPVYDAFDFYAVHANVGFNM